MSRKLEGEGGCGSQSPSVPFSSNHWKELKERGLIQSEPSSSMRQKGYHQINAGDRFQSQAGLLKVKAITGSIAHLANRKGETFMLRVSELMKVKADRKSISFTIGTNHGEVLISGQDTRDRLLWESAKEIFRRNGFVPAEANESLWQKQDTNIENETSTIESEFSTEGFGVYAESNGGLTKMFYVFMKVGETVDASKKEASTVPNWDQLDPKFKRFLRSPDGFPQTDWKDVWSTVEQNEYETLLKKFEFFNNMSDDVEASEEKTIEYNGQTWVINKENPNGTLEISLLGDPDPYIITVTKDQIKALGSVDTKKKTIVFDFDGTITKQNTFPEIAEPNTFIVQLMAEAKELGFEVIIHSCRTSTELNDPATADDQLRQMKEYLEVNGIPYDSIYTSNKPIAILYVDDKGCNVLDQDMIRQVIHTAKRSFK